MPGMDPPTQPQSSGVFARIKGKLLAGIVLGGLVYVALSVYTGYHELLDALRRIDWLMIPILFALSSANYLLRFCKWDFYLHRLGIRLSKKESMAVFFSGLVMVITPGKMGELLKAYLLRTLNGTPVSRSAPIVVAERLTDFLALIALTSVGIGAYAFEAKWLIMTVTTAGTVGFIALIMWRRASLWVLSLLERIGPLAKVGHKMHLAYESIFTMVSPAALLWSTILSIGAWFCECFGLWITLRFFIPDPNLLAATFIYAIATIAGAISMVPGGLGTTEAAITAALIKLMGVAEGSAAAATFVIRVATLWFAVLLGAFVLAMNQKRFAGAGALLDQGSDEA